MSLTNECMTVNLHIGQWGGYRFDKEQTRKVLESTGASDGAARVNKSLVDKAQLKPVTSAANAIRTHFYRYTLRHRFYADLEIDVVSEAKDFRVDIEKGEAERVKSQIEGSIQRRINDAMGDLWSRLSERLEHYREKTADEKAVFRDSLVTNLQDIVDLIPSLNLIDDPELERIADDIRSSIYGIDAKDLRKDGAVRKHAATEADRIMTEMEGLMKAFGAAA